MTFLTPSNGPDRINKTNFLKIGKDGELQENLNFPLFVRAEFLRIRQIPSKPRFIVDNDGSFFFHYSRNLWLLLSKYASFIHKIDPENYNIEWSFTPPNSVYSLRNHSFTSFHLAQDGNILAVGFCTDNTDLSFNGPLNFFNGFVLKFDPRGEIIWYRLVKFPNHEFIPKDDFGWFQNSVFARVLELNDGRIALGGVKYLENEQYDANNPLEYPPFKIWLLVLDENGCYDGHECQSIIRLDYPEIIDPPVFPIGTKWTYDYFPESDDPNQIINSYITYEVTDSFLINDTLIYLVENNRGLPDELMLQNDYLVWFWDDYLNDWQLTYDFRAFIDYTTFYSHEDSTIKIHYKIDTVDLSFYFGERHVEKVQRGHLVYKDSLLSDQMNILEGCGRLNGGLKLPFNGNANGDNPMIGDIRCFEQGDFFWNFKPILFQIDCDSIWIETRTSTSDLGAIGSHVIYPNPSSGDFYISPTINNLPYQVYDNKGRKVAEGLIKNSRIPQLPEGHYLIKILNDGYTKSFKVISTR